MTTADLSKTPDFTDAQHLAVQDWEFCNSHKEEFQRQGRFSMTCALRTVVSMQSRLTRKEFIEVFSWFGFNKGTLAIQFAKSRKFDAEMYGKTIAADGSFKE